LRGHRGGTPVRTCDGCYKVLPSDDKHVQVLNLSGTKKDWCGDYTCQKKIQDNPDPPYRCPNCVIKGEECRPEHRRDHGPDRETGEKMDEATPHQDVIY
jgi:hypothetical protein